MLYTILMVTEVLLSIGLITLILMQHGKGADAGAAFGSGASGTVFGSRGASNFLSRTTAILATLFFLNCLALAFFVANQPKTSSVIDTLIEQGGQVQKPASEAAPADLPVESGGATENSPAESGSVVPQDIPE